MELDVYGTFQEQLVQEQEHEYVQLLAGQEHSERVDGICKRRQAAVWDMQVHDCIQKTESSPMIDLNEPFRDNNYTPELNQGVFLHMNIDAALADHIV